VQNGRCHVRRMEKSMGRRATLKERKRSIQEEGVAKSAIIIAGGRDRERGKREEGTLNGPRYNIATQERR